MPTECQGHDLSVQETQTNHAPHITEGVQPEGRIGAGPGGVVTSLAWLVEQRWLHGSTTAGNTTCDHGLYPANM